MNWRWFGLIGGAIAAAGAIYFWRQENLPCPTTGEILTRADITEGAFVYAAANLRNLHRFNGTLNEDGTAFGAQITAQMVKELQPDCCRIIRNAPSGLASRTERVLFESGGPNVRAYVEATIDTPALLTPQFDEVTVTVAVDVCGSPVQDWFDLTPPALE